MFLHYIFLLTKIATCIVKKNCQQIFCIIVEVDKMNIAIEYFYRYLKVSKTMSCGWSKTLHLVPVFALLSLCSNLHELCS